MCTQACVQWENRWENRSDLFSHREGVKMKRFMVFAAAVEWKAGTVTNFFIHAPEDWQVLAGKDVQEANSILTQTTTA